MCQTKAHIEKRRIDVGASDLRKIRTKQIRSYINVLSGSSLLLIVPAVREREAAG